MPRPRALRIAVLVGVLALGAGVGRALTASIPSWAPTRAGSGSVAVSPFAVSGVTYTLDAVSPQNLDAVGFTLAPAGATTVRIAIAGAVYPCTGTTSVTCDTTAPQATAVAANTSELVVVAVQ